MSGPELSMVDVSNMAVVLVVDLDGNARCSGRASLRQQRAIFERVIDRLDVRISMGEDDT